MSDAGWGRDRPLRAKPGAVFGDDEGDPALRANAPATPPPPAPTPVSPAGGDRVDSLFTDAIERQVAEQRNLNRLLQEIERSIGDVRGRVDELQTQVAREVGPTFDRLAAVDAAVTALRENSASQTVALRAEMQELLEGIRKELRTSAEAQGSELVELRSIEEQLGDRLSAVNRTVESVTERLATRQESFGQDLQRLIARVTDIGESSEDTRDLLGPQAARFEEAVNGMVDRVQSALDRQLARIEQVEGRWQSIEAAIDDRLAKVSETVAEANRSAFAQLRRELSEQIEAGVSDMATSQRSTLDDAAGRQQRMLEGLAEQVRTAIAGVNAELAEIESVATRVNQSRMLDEDSRGVLRNELLEDLRVANDVTLGKLRDRVEDGFAALRDRIVHQLEELDERVAGSEEKLTEFGRAQDERLGVVSVDAQAVGERLDGLAGEIERQSRALGGVTDDLGTMGETLGQVLGEMQARIVAAQEEGLADVKATLEEAELRLIRSRELFDQAAVQVEGATGRLGEQLSQALAEVAVEAREQSGETIAELSAAADRLARTSESVRALEGSMVEYLQARDRRYEEQRMAVLGDLVRQLGDHLSRRDRRRIGEQIDLARAVNAAPPAPLLPEPVASRPVADREPEAIEARVDAELEDLSGDQPDDEVVRTRGRTRASSARSSRPGTVRELEALSKAALYERAKKLKIPGRSGMSRDDLVEAIADREG